MSQLLNKSLTLVCNRHWMAYDLWSTKKAFESICSLNPETGNPPFLALDLTYAQREDETFDTDQLISARPVNVTEWFALPVRSCDLAIMTGRGEVRVPTIIVAFAYADLPVKTIRFTPDNVKRAYGYVCQATKERLHPDELDMGHDIARTNGGQRNWQNIAPIRKDLNRMQGTRTFAEMGWDIRPKAPKARRVVFTESDISHPSHLHFVARN